MNRADEMRELFARWKRSDQSLMAFGKAEGISYKSLLYWRRKLGDEATRRAAPVVTSEASTLWPITIVPDEPSSPSADIFEVKLTNGIALTVAPDFNEPALRRLVGALLAC